MSEIKNLPTNIDRDFFLDESVGSNWITIYTDWVAKLQTAGLPAIEWINSQLDDIHEIHLSYIRRDTQDIIHTIQWPQWTHDNLHNISTVSIDRFAITELPPWIYNMSHLAKLRIQDVLKKDNDEILHFYHKHLPSLVIPSKLAAVKYLKELDLSLNEIPYQFDSEFCRKASITTLRIYVSSLQSPLEDLGFFPNLTTLELYSHHPLSSYSFLTPLRLVKSFKIQAKLERIPEEIRHLVALERLDLSQNCLTDLPNWLATLSCLRTLIIDPAPRYDIESNKLVSFFPDLNPLTEFPNILRYCSSLLYCTIGVPVRSLYNLPPIARYWSALAFAYPETKGVFDLPKAICEAVKHEFDPIFEPHINPNREEYMHPLAIQHLDSIGAQFPHPLQYYQDRAKYLKISPAAGLVYMTKKTATSCIICGIKLEQRFCPICGMDNGIYASNDSCLHCRAPGCGAARITGICPRCGVDNRLGLAYHPQLVAWLEHFYADSYETLFDRVRNGELLHEPLFSRFIHETTRHHYQLLFNTAQTHLDSAILDELTQKFSIPFTDSTKIIL